MSSNLVRPACGSTDVKKLIYTSQGGILWTPFLNFIKCRACGARFSGKTGELDPQVPKGMRIISVIVILGFIGLLVGFALALSSNTPTENSTPARVPTVNVPTPSTR
ncbi:MAG: hypothetical protein H7Z16_10450 [Pyrinomonadaceae bacterium]|nr:hypothetical protein [Pyrinomonadaceae bacterium]